MKKRRIQLLLAVFMVCFGITLITIAFFFPPSGYIDPTVLTAYGETLTFAGSLIGLDYHYRAKRKMNEDDDENEDNLSAA